MGVTLAVGFACATPDAEPESAPVVPPSTSALKTIDSNPVESQSSRQLLLGYLSQAAGTGPHPAILVIHENRGLLPHFPDYIREVAREEYVALAIDLLSGDGGADRFSDSDAARSALSAIPQDQVVEDMNGAVTYLQGLNSVRPDQVGAMGLCFVGSMVWLLSVRNPEIQAAAPFYGSAPPLDEVSNLRVAVLGNYAEDDNRINQGAPDLENALKQYQKEHKFRTYPVTRHAFINVIGGRYVLEAADDVWDKTLSWMEQHLMV